MKIPFVLGFPNPFPGAGWTRIGFFAKDWSNKGHAIEVQGAFSHTLLQKKGFIFNTKAAVQKQNCANQKCTER